MTIKTNLGCTDNYVKNLWEFMGSATFLSSPKNFKAGNRFFGDHAIRIVAIEHLSASQKKFDADYEYRYQNNTSKYRLGNLVRNLFSHKRAAQGDNQENGKHPVKLGL